MDDRSDLRVKMREFYATAETYKRQLQRHDEAYMWSYVEIVSRYVRREGRMLELGGGTGIAARMLHERGYRTVGTDLSPLFLQEAAGWQTDGLAFSVCDGLELPFQDATFQNVCSYEYLEHVPDAKAALDEICRVTQPGGLALSLGPNLLSPLVPLMEWVNMVRRGEASSAFSGSRADAMRLMKGNWDALRRKKRSPQVEFLYRQPELDESTHGGDADSSYLVNPIDLVRYFESRGWSILAKAVGVGWKGRLLARWTPYHSPYLCVIAQKPK
ncbi:MAG: class I SAM-dependent methyltransferase [Candidatus Poribacteria bacterium]|nr:class I SAM-dependent methyltransferase [Candidatus Poribacteria bacterium]